MLEKTANVGHRRAAANVTENSTTVMLERIASESPLESIRMQINQDEQMNTIGHEDTPWFVSCTLVGTNGGVTQRYATTPPRDV